MNRLLASSALAVSLALTQVNVSWAGATQPIRELSAECGPVFAFASKANQGMFSSRLEYSTRRDSVLKEYLWVQRRTLTFKALAEEASGAPFEMASTDQAKLRYDACFAQFSKQATTPEWAEVRNKIDQGAIDQALEDMIFEKLSVGYQRVMLGSKQLRHEMPFSLGSQITASRLVFDPPNLVMYAKVNDKLGQDDIQAQPMLCAALEQHKFDRALYPLLRLRVVTEQSTLATASGSQCNQ